MQICQNIRQSTRYFCVFPAIERHCQRRLVAGFLAAPFEREQPGQGPVRLEPVGPRRNRAPQITLRCRAVVAQRIERRQIVPGIERIVRRSRGDCCDRRIRLKLS